MAIGLLEDSPLYRDKVMLYKYFAECEDAPELVTQALAPYIKGQCIADVGCGTGKYLGKFASSSEQYFAIDQAEAVLSVAREKSLLFPQSACFLASAEALPLASDSVDVVLSSWVWGTVQEETRRRAILNEALRVLKEDGVILLVENDIGGEFEKIRGRFPDMRRTAEYNDWLQECCGFKLLKTIKSYFQFESAFEAQEVFRAIYGADAAARVNGAQIEHNVVLYMLKK